MTPRKVWSKWVETRKDPNKPWYESSGLSPREGSARSKSRTKCAKRCGWSSGCFEPHLRQRSLHQRVDCANATFADLKAWSNREPFRSTAARSERSEDCSSGVRDTSQVFATHVEKRTRSSVPWWYWKATLKTCTVYWRDGFIPTMSGVRANNLEHSIQGKSL